MKIVQVNLAPPPKGIAPEALLDLWPTLRDVAIAVNRAGAEVTVIQSFDRDAELSREGVRFRFVPQHVARAVAAEKPDAIHVNGLDFAWHTRLLSRLGPPVLVQDHAGNARWRPMVRRLGLGRVSGAAFTDAAQAEPFFANGSLPRGLPVFAIPESSTLFTPGDREEARRESGIFGDPAVLWVGRLDANKDPLTALDAVELAAADLPDLRLWCCFHRADLLAEVQARIDRSPLLKSRVRLLGQVPHAAVETLCRAADLFLSCSHSEGSGYALIEAMACGAVPVVSDIPAFRALTDGPLAAVGDAAAFARGLIDRAGQPRQRTIAHFQKELSFAVVGAKLCAAYRMLTR